MKHIRKFNEELEFKTYNNAAYKLKKMGHVDRSNALVDWANKKEWIRIKEIYSKFGEFKMNLEGDNISLTDDFYLVIEFDSCGFEDSIDALEEGEEIYLSFFVGIVPLNEKSIEKIEEIIPDGDMDNGFYWTNFAFFTIKKEDCKIKIINFDIDNYYQADVSFANRASANNFKNIIIKLFSDPNFNYVHNNYKFLESEILIKNGLSSDYGFELEDIAKYMKTISPNTLYKTLK